MDRSPSILNRIAVGISFLLRRSVYVAVLGHPMTVFGLSPVVGPNPVIYACVSIEPTILKLTKDGAQTGQKLRDFVAQDIESANATILVWLGKPINPNVEEELVAGTKPTADDHALLEPVIGSLAKWASRLQVFHFRSNSPPECGIEIHVNPTTIRTPTSCGLRSCLYRCTSTGCTRG